MVKLGPNEDTIFCAAQVRYHKFWIRQASGSDVKIYEENVDSVRTQF